MRKLHKPHYKKRRVIPLIGGVVVFLVLVFIAWPSKEYKLSRENIVLMTPSGAQMYSFDTQSGLHYHFSFPRDMYVPVVGGYGMYKVSALPQLEKLEKKPFLMRYSFSYLMGVPIQKVVVLPSDSLTLGNVLKGNGYSVTDKVKLYLLISKYKKLIKSVAVKDLPYATNERQVNRDALQKTVESVFFESVFRQENKQIILYYENAAEAPAKLEYVLEGEGMNVIRIDKRAKEKKVCTIEVSAQSKTSETIATFLGCNTILKPDVPADLVYVTLGEQEEHWK